jgi:hypothetical protein
MKVLIGGKHYTVTFGTAALARLQEHHGLTLDELISQIRISRAERQLNIALLLKVLCACIGRTDPEKLADELDIVEVPAAFAAVEAAIRDAKNRLRQRYAHLSRKVN